MRITRIYLSLHNSESNEISYKFVKKMFPNATIRPDAKEVNGLDVGTIPANVTIINKWLGTTHTNDRREFFHVTDGEHVALLRVCTAMEGCGYDEFAVIHELAEVGTPLADDVEETAIRWAPYSR